ncbi:MAG TPA: hypothetical protein DCE80_05360, partial [Ignavibacteriales bacterium]|nr:hypothetical protein [Ignavibacteriales bacterium]
DNCGMARAFGNTITKTNKQNQGIVVYGATESYIAQNNISGFGHGIYIGSTDAFFTDDGFQSPYPNNLLTNNYYGVMVGWGSFLCAGWDESHGGDNSIYSNDSYDIYVYQFSNANASYNYWGSGDPNQYVDGTSYLEVLPILTSNPWGYQSAIKLITSDETLTPESQQINTKAKSTSATQDVGTSKGLLTQVQTTQLNYNQGTAKDDDEFLKGIKLKKEGQIDEAIEQLKKVVKDKKYGLYAITELAGIKTRYGKENIQPYFEDLVKEPNAENKSRIKKALAGFYLSNNEDDRALVIYDELKDSKSSKRDNFEGLYEKFNVMLHKKKDLETAKTLLAELKNKFADDADAMIHISTAEVLMSGKRTPAFGKKQSGSEVSTEVEAPKEYALFNNYPNPFNPVTTISYQLPKDGFVTLKVFDILGNELITLVNDQRSAGTYTMHFDASSLSSGMYVYQLRVNDYTSTKKM